MSFVLFEICAAGFGWLLLYRAFLLPSDIREVRRKLALPELQGTAHHRTLQVTLANLEERQHRLRRRTFLLGGLALGMWLWSAAG